MASFVRRDQSDFSHAGPLPARPPARAIGINDLIFLGVAVYFLLTMETRIKRRRALEALHQIRSVVHIVDMHQLTKDPERLLTAHLDTASSRQKITLLERATRPEDADTGSCPSS